MKEQNPADKWIRGKNQPFMGGKQKLSSIPKHQRRDYISKIMEIPQLQVDPPFNFRAPFLSQSSFQYNGHKIQYYSVENHQKPKAIVICIHGLNSNGHFFSYIANKINQNSKETNVYAFDQLNFGKSQGPYRGEVASFQDSINQTTQFVQLIKVKFQNNPKIFLLGHSYGGAIAFKLSIINEQAYSGIILLTPALRDLHHHYYWLKQIAKLIGFFMPRLRLSKPPPGKGTKYNLTQKFINDELIYTDGIVPGTIRSMLNAVQQVSTLFNKFKSPFLGIGAGIQKITDIFALLDLQQECLSEDKQVIICQNMWHVVNEEQQLQDITWVICEWLKQRT